MRYQSAPVTGKYGSKHGAIREVDNDAIGWSIGQGHAAQVLTLSTSEFIVTLMINTDPLRISSKEAWLKYGLGAEVDIWLDNIDKKTRRLIRLYKAGKNPFVEEAELIYDYAALINRLAHFSYAQVEPLDTTKIASRIAKWTKWNGHIAYAFWRGLRDPIVHLGRTNAFTDYEISYKKGKLTVGHKDLSYKEPKRFNKPNWADFQQAGPGWEQHQVPGQDGEPDSYHLNFNFGGVRKMVQVMVESVRAEVAAMSDEDMKKLEALNERMPFYWSVVQKTRNSTAPPS
jgi:hypothetical protein